MMADALDHDAIMLAENNENNDNDNDNYDEDEDEDEDTDGDDSSVELCKEEMGTYSMRLTQFVYPQVKYAHFLLGRTYPDDNIQEQVDSIKMLRKKEDTYFAKKYYENLDLYLICIKYQNPTNDDDHQVGMVETTNENEFESIIQDSYKLKLNRLQEVHGLIQDLVKDDNYNHPMYNHPMVIVKFCGTTLVEMDLYIRFIPIKLNVEMKKYHDAAVELRGNILDIYNTQYILLGEGYPRYEKKKSFLLFDCKTRNHFAMIVYGDDIFVKSDVEVQTTSVADQYTKLEIDTTSMSE